MEINANTAAGTTAKPATASTTPLAQDFQTFLTLLTTQMRNQDPTKPMESTEFVAQLASFASVEQQTQTNTLLAQLVTSGGASELSDHVHWIGKSVALKHPFTFAGEPVTMNFAEPTSEETTLAIHDDDGTVIYSETLPAGSTSVTWNGRNNAGAEVAPGAYTYLIGGYRQTVIGIEGGGSSPLLVLDDGTRRALDDAGAVYS